MKTSLPRARRNNTVEGKTGPHQNTLSPPSGTCCKIVLSLIWLLTMEYCRDIISLVKTGRIPKSRLLSLTAESTYLPTSYILMGSQSHHEKHSNRQQKTTKHNIFRNYTTFSEILSRTCHLFSTTYTGSALVRDSSNSLRELGLSENCNGVADHCSITPINTTIH
jgi:hypothetical protein